MSINNPQIGVGRNRLIERALGIPRIKAAYHARTNQLLETVFAEDKMATQINDVSLFLQPWIEQPERSKVLNRFISERHASVRRQLAGESNGEVHAFGQHRKKLSLVGPGLLAVLTVVLSGLVLFKLQAIARHPVPLDRDE